MNMHTLHYQEIGGAETLYRTSAEVPVDAAAEQTAALHMKGMTARHLLHCARRIGRTGGNALIFLTLGATGLWSVVDLVKHVIDSFAHK